ncbi:MAG TPA: phage holin family protein [Steroidobacteraceae bacterium]|jgi:uncharacterized membrane protein YqjE|nr:phage holin family protein [Steroidobacteraceae bacterium]
MNPATPSFTERSRSLLRQLLAMGQTRLEMLGLEVEREVGALGRELRLAAICIIAAWLSATALLLWIAVAFPRAVGLWILGVLCVLFAITSLVSWRVLQRVSRRERLFSRLADQLRQDAQALESLTGADERD